MDNFIAVFKILDGLEKSLDLNDPDMDSISPDTLGISQNRWARIMVMLIDAGYVKGESTLYRVFGEGEYRDIHPGDLQITLKGLEYLEDNSQMKKAREFLKTAVGLAGTVAGAAASIMT